MIKSILKETIIILLLCVAILLILSVLFYDYNPINKVVPNKIAYTVPDNIREELEEENVQNAISIENKVYTIEGSDLTLYRKSNSYNPSKENPFATTTQNGNHNNGQNTNVNIDDNQDENTKEENTNTNVNGGSSNTNTNPSSKTGTGLK